MPRVAAAAQVDPHDAVILGERAVETVCAVETGGLLDGLEGAIAGHDEEIAAVTALEERDARAVFREGVLQR